MHAQAPHAAQAQAPSQVKKDPYQELERLGSLKQQGLLSEEEFQKLKMRYSRAFKSNNFFFCCN
jgi:Short C-terminal domain